MRILTYLLLIAALAFGRASAAVDDEADPSPEAKAISAIESLMSKKHQGGDNPTPLDLKARHDAAVEMARKALQFLSDFPKSKRTEDANALINTGLMQAVLVVTGSVRIAFV